MRRKLTILLTLLTVLVVAVVGRVGQLPTQPLLAGTGDSTPDLPKLFVSGGRENRPSGGLIALSAAEEPLVELTSYETGGEAEITVYRASQEALLDYLTHDDEGKQLKVTPDEDHLDQLTIFTHQVASGYGQGSQVTLPIEGSGIWYLKINFSGATEHAFVIRSQTGVLVKEGDDELIFWAQDFASLRRVGNGEVKLYSLLNGQEKLAEASFNDEGIARIDLDAGADIALVERGNDRAVVPINLRYLNAYQYQPFQPKSRQTKYFVFTDRPLYRPGGKVFFKAVLRDDDDARYSIPGGSALVKVYPGWDEKDAVYERQLPISGSGTINGEMTIPENSQTGSFTVKVNVLPSSANRVTWYDYYQEYNTTSFQVEHFRKPEYSLDITSSQDEYISGDEATAIISGEYFFGQPVRNQPVKYQIYASNFYEYQYLTSYQRALDDDHRWYRGREQTVSEGTATFDQQGQAAVPLPTDFAGNKGKTQIFSVEAEFGGESGSPAFARKNILVRSGEFGLYRKSYGGYGAEVGKPISLTVVAVSDQAGVDLANLPLTVRIERSEWIKYYEADHKYPSFREEKEVLPLLNFQTNSAGEAALDFTPTKAGTHIFTVETRDQRGNRVSNEFRVWVSKAGEAYYGGQYSGTLTIQPDKEEYSPGDSARLTIFSDIPDRDVFLSLDRARANRFRVIHIGGNSTTVDINLVDTDRPNIYASAASFNGYSLSSNQVNLPVSTVGLQLTTRLTPDRQEYGPGDQVVIGLKTEDHQGQPVSAEAAVWVVDKAIFELAGNQAGEIFDRFWSSRYHNTQLSHSLVGIYAQTAEGGGCFGEETPVLMSNGQRQPIKDIVSGDWILTRSDEANPTLVPAKVLAVHRHQLGGVLIVNSSLRITLNHYLWVNGQWQEANQIKLGDRLVSAQNESVMVNSVEWQAGNHTVYNLEVEDRRTFFADNVWVHNQKGDQPRTTFKDTAYWNPTVQTGRDGQAQVRFTLPDNLTTWVVAAIGSTTNHQFGQTTEEVVVTKDVIMRPILPNLLRVDDQINLAALVHNFTATDQDFDFELKFNAGEVKGLNHSPTTIVSGDFEQLNWRVTPQQANETAQLTFTAQSTADAAAADTVVKEIPVKKFGFWEATGQFSPIEDNPVEFPLQLSRDHDPELTQISLSLSPTIIGTLPTAMRYLLNYPYGCVEQTTSRFVSAVIAKEYPQLFAEALQEDVDVDEILDQSVARLALMQHGDGGWSWWRSGRSDPFVSAYVVEYLVKAQRLGVKVNSRIINQAEDFFTRGAFEDLDPEESSDYERNARIARAYALAILEANEGREAVTNFENITPDFLSLAVMANYKNGYRNSASNGLNQLMTVAKTQGDGLYWETGNSRYYGSRNASTALAIRALLTAGGDRQQAARAAHFLLRNRQTEYWSNTFATAQAVQALVDLYHSGDESEPDYTWTASLNGEAVQSGTVTAADKTIEALTISAEQLPQDPATLTIGKDGPGQLYATLTVDQFHTDRNAAAESRGLTVRRSYHSERGPGYRLAVGDTVTVEITLSGLTNEERYAVIKDELPAGLVPVNPSLQNEQFLKDPGSYYSSYGVSDREVTANGMVLSLYRVRPGSHTYTYQARAVTSGVFAVPPATASLMYAPELSGRSAAGTVRVADTAGPGLQPFASRGDTESIVFWATTTILGGIGLYGAYRLIRKRRQQRQSDGATEATTEAKTKSSKEDSPPDQRPDRPTTDSKGPPPS